MPRSKSHTGGDDKYIIFLSNLPQEFQRDWKKPKDWVRNVIRGQPGKVAFSPNGMLCIELKGLNDALLAYEALKIQPFEGNRHVDVYMQTPQGDIIPSSGSLQRNHPPNHWNHGQASPPVMSVTDPVTPVESSMPGSPNSTMMEPYYHLPSGVPTTPAESNFGGSRRRQKTALEIHAWNPRSPAVHNSHSHTRWSESERTNHRLPTSYTYQSDPMPPFYESSDTMAQTYTNNHFGLPVNTSGGIVPTRRDSIRIFGLHKRTTQADVWTLLEAHGHATHVQRVELTSKSTSGKAKSSALVIFRDVEGIAAAIEDLDGLKSGSQTLHVRYAKESRADPFMVVNGST